MIQVSCKLCAHMNELETTHAGSSAGSEAGAICERAALERCVPVSLCSYTVLYILCIWLGSNSTWLVRWGQTTRMVVLAVTSVPTFLTWSSCLWARKLKIPQRVFAFWSDQQPQAEASLLNLQSCNMFFFRISANVGIYLQTASHQRSHWPWLLPKSICSLRDSFKCNIGRMRPTWDQGSGLAPALAGSNEKVRLGAEMLVWTIWTETRLAAGLFRVKWRESGIDYPHIGLELTFWGPAFISLSKWLKSK